MPASQRARRLGLGVAVLLPFLAAAPAARASEIFANLPGAWSGGGTAVLQDGTNERIRCRVTYSVAPSGDTVRQDLGCASDSYKIAMKSDILYQNGELAGTWTETGRQASGSIRGRVDGDTITTAVSGLKFHADVAITTHGNKQTIRINSEGSWAKSVSIDLHGD